MGLMISLSFKNADIDDISDFGESFLASAGW